MKEHRSTFIDLDYSYLKSQSQTAFDSVYKIQEKIQHKLDDSYENQDRKPQGQFDIGKLEQIKEKTNKNFFDKMETLKNTKKGTATQENMSANKTDDLIDLDPVDNKNNIDDDLFGLDLDSTPKKTVQVNNDRYGGLDLLGNDDLVIKPSIQGDDLLFDFQQNMNISKPINKKGGSLIDDDMFRDLDTVMQKDSMTKKTEGKSTDQNKDPFDFIAF